MALKLRGNMRPEGFTNGAKEGGFRFGFIYLLTAGILFSATLSAAVGLAAPAANLRRIDNPVVPPVLQNRFGGWDSHILKRLALTQAAASRASARGFSRDTTDRDGSPAPLRRRFTGTDRADWHAASRNASQTNQAIRAPGDCQWVAGFGAPGLDGPVYALEKFDDGSGPALYAGGWFATAGGVIAFSIAKWDGSAWSPLGSGINGIVYALAVYDDGTGPALYVGGNFIDAGGVPASNLAKWDGAAWSAVGGGLPDGEVRALAVYDDGGGPALFAGGGFTLAGPEPGLPVWGIARWDGTSWSSVGGGMDDWVLSLTVYDDGSGPALFAGGDFVVAGDPPDLFVWYIAKWNGTAWSAVADGLDGSVRSLAVYDDGAGDALFIGGDITAGYYTGGAFVSAFGIIKWSGSSWEALGAGVGFGADFFRAVSALTVFDDGGGSALFVGGNFDTAGGSPAAYIARWRAGAWSPVAGGMDDQVFALAVYDDSGGSALYAGGYFTIAGIVPSAFIAKWHCPSLDYGDAPGLGYPTLFSDDGARHTVTTGVYLGAGADVELDGQPDASAAGDDISETDDENGVSFTSFLSPGFPASIEVTASAPGKLDAWIDLNRDGDWNDPGEKIYDGFDISAGNNQLSFTIPADTATGTGFARFRYSEAGSLLPIGRALDGEVEDYEITVDPATTFTINDVTLTEGDTGQTAFSFTVTRNHNLHATQVSYATADGSAASGSDYTALALQTLGFPANGALTQTITVQVGGDNLVESDETFFVNLSNPVGAAISDARGVGTIRNDDTASISIGDVVRMEGNSGTTDFVFTVTLSVASELPITVDYATVDGTAQDESGQGDYLATSGTLTFDPGITTRAITVAVISDSDFEAPSEDFYVILSNASGAAISDGRGTGVINNDDPDPDVIPAVNDIGLGLLAILLIATGMGSLRRKMG